MKVKRSTLAKILATVFVVNLVVMGIGAWYSYQQAPPIPKQVEGPSGQTLVTAQQVREGKTVFQSNGLMNHGSILGNGAYFGKDFTADALHLKVQFMRRYYAREQYGTTDYGSLSAQKQATVDVAVKSDLNDGDPGETIRYSAAEAYAHRHVRQVYVDRYHDGAPERGVPQGMIGNTREAKRFADFALWTAWFAHTDRPGSSHTYTNDWPYQPVAGNDPTGATMTWSVVAMVLLVAGAGAGVWLYKSIELPEPSTEGVSIPSPDEVDLFPGQAAALKFVVVGAGLFLAQVLLGGLLAHYYIERAGFFGLGKLVGVNPLQWLPFSIARTWHIDLAILWISTLWLGAGLFLPPLLTGHEPENQRTYINYLLGALVVVVVGGLAGIWLGANGYIDGNLWWILGDEGLEYLDVGRLWQVGILVGFLGWAALVARGFKPVLDREPRYGLAHMILYAGGSIALLFCAGFLYTPRTNIVVTEFWRWWVVHMWVEGAFEFFVVALTGFTLVSMNLLEKRSAEKAVMVQALLVMGTGVIGVSHHYWWVGQPDVWVPLGSAFSTLELIPLVFILYEAIGQYRAMTAGGAAFPYTLPFTFIVASGVWNFVGAGVLGFFINLPVINYFEHGTYLTVAHAHAAMFGAFGFLALGMVAYMLQIAVPESKWDDTNLRRAFWAWNVGLAVMVAISLLPVGFLQLETAFTRSYDAARSLSFYDRPLVQLLFWARMPGDTIFIIGTAIFSYDVARKVLNRGETTPTDDPADSPVAAGSLVDGDD